MYTYFDLLDDVNYLAHYQIETGCIGSSESGKLIPYIFVGKKDGAQIIVTAGIHAREHVTSLLLMKQVYQVINHAYPCSGGIYFIPMVNPDGNLLAAGMAAELDQDMVYRAVSMNGESKDFSLWKANLCGVDLNTNFDARWGSGKYNVTVAGSENYIGESPESAAETRALCEFTNMVKPNATVSYHALGHELYWRFHQPIIALQRDNAFAEYVNSLLKFKKIDEEIASAGGYKDWCISALKIPSLTIEFVSESHKHPLSDSAIHEDLLQNALLPAQMLQYFNNYSKKTDKK